MKAKTTKQMVKIGCLGLKTRNTTMGSCRGAENGLKQLKINVYWSGSTFEVIAGV